MKELKQEVIEMSKGLKKCLDRIKPNFTEEAFSVVFAFITELDELLGRSSNKSTIKQTMDGIFSYIDEFTDEIQTTVNYSQALELLMDLGSPSVIVQSLDVKMNEELSVKEDFSKKEVPIEYPVDIETGKICLLCKWVNIQSSSNCQSCGNLLSKENIERGGIKQSIIDHPYNSSFIIMSILISLIIGIFVISRPELVYGNFDSFSSIFYLIIGLSILVDIIFTFVLGSIISRSYKNQRSFKLMYKKALEGAEINFAGNVTLAYIIILLHFIYLLFLSFTIEFRLITTILSLLYGLSLFTMFGIFPVLIIINLLLRPKKLTYLRILEVNTRVGKSYKSSIIKINRKIIPISVTLSLIWMTILGFFTNLDFLENLTSSILIFLFYLGIQNVVYSMYKYSWHNIIRELKSGE